MGGPGIGLKSHRQARLRNLRQYQDHEAERGLTGQRLLIMDPSILHYHKHDEETQLSGKCDADNRCSSQIEMPLSGEFEDVEALLQGLGGHMVAILCGCAVVIFWQSYSAWEGRVALRLLRSDRLE
jgi:hypothetical protein